MTEQTPRESLVNMVVANRLTDESTEIANRIIALLAPLTEDQRSDVFYQLFCVYCSCCGGMQPASGRSCQCSNDE